MQNTSRVLLSSKYNLTQIQLMATHGKQIATPIAFINTNECKTILRDITGQSTPHSINFVLDTDSNHYYTNSKWLFLAYISYCMNADLSDAIKYAIDGSEVVA